MSLLGSIQVLSTACAELDPLVRIIKHGLFPIVQIGIPILLIVFATIDLGKAVMANKDDKIKEAQSMLIKRAIYAAAIFFVVTLVTIVMNLVAKSEDDNIENGATTSWQKCWKDN